ncbi:EI24 domain-containing protein [Plastorhodobacter daqingensis]|uniref:EI24 domain-containing protein n=1 Tax=Plastorhodobacter daqingensis TaxID=1387281 RepID=A0ABW2UG24_9RHOB
MILIDMLRALGQWSDPRFRRVIWLGLGLSLALLVAVYALLLGLIGWFVPAQIDLPLLGPFGGLSALLSVGSLLVMLALSPILMMPVASAFTGFFLDDVAQAVEDRHYPHLAKAPDVPLYDQLRDGFNYFALLVGVNILAGGVYLFSGPLALPVFWAVNGYLLGREYFQMVAMRRLGRRGASDLRAANWFTIWAAGTMMAAPLSIPIVNLFVPVLGAASFTHLFHRLSPAAAPSVRTSQDRGW